MGNDLYLKAGYVYSIHQVDFYYRSEKDSIKNIPRLQEPNWASTTMGYYDEVSLDEGEKFLVLQTIKGNYFVKVLRFKDGSVFWSDINPPTKENSFHSKNYRIYWELENYE